MPSALPLHMITYWQYCGTFFLLTFLTFAASIQIFYADNSKQNLFIVVLCDT